MIHQNFQSVTVPYRTVAELGDGVYYSDIPEPWGEKLFNGLAPMGLSVSGDTISMTGWTAQRAWPSWSLGRWIFNAITGEFVGRANFSGLLTWSAAHEVYEGASGDFFMQTTSGAIYRYDAITGTVDVDSLIPPSRYGRIIITAPMWDTGRDRVVMGGQSGEPQLEVYEMGSGTLLKTINVPHSVEETVYAGDSRIYALLVDGSLLGVDYLTGEVFQHTKTPIKVDSLSTQVAIAWSRTYRRLLVCTYEPDHEDGTSATRIKGYRNVPIPVHLCKPIPLKPLRTGKKSPVLVKQIGDLGEGLAGMLTVTSEEAALITRNAVALDGDGEGTTEVLGVGEGESVITVSTEIPDGYAE